MALLIVMGVLFIVLCVLWALANYPRYKAVYDVSVTIAPRGTGEANAKRGWK